MEDTNSLDPCDEIDIFALHFVFLKHINNHLAEWADAWNRHPISGEHNFSPQQLWTIGMVQLVGSGSLIANELEAQCFENISEVCLRMMKFGIHNLYFNYLQYTKTTLTFNAAEPMSSEGINMTSTVKVRVVFQGMLLSMPLYIGHWQQ